MVVALIVIALATMIYFALIMIYITIRGACRLFFRTKQCYHIRGNDGCCRMCRATMAQGAPGNF